jgi:hypothetical protein
MPKKPKSGVPFTPSLAAQYLASRIGHTPELWVYRLANWRRPGRQSPIPWTTTEAGHPVYSSGDLDDFAEKQLASQVVLDSAADKERPRAGAIPMLDDTAAPHVRVTFATGSVTQSVFAIDAPSARRLAKMLEKCAVLVEKATGQG